MTIYCGILFSKLGKVAYFFKSRCLSKKPEGTFLRKKFICLSLHRHFRFQHVLWDIRFLLLGQNACIAFLQS